MIVVLLVKGTTPRSDDLCHTYDYSHVMIYQIFQGRHIPDLYDLYDLAHAAGWEPYITCMN